MNPDAGEVLREGFLRHGNGRLPSDMYKNILNEELEPDALIESIVSEFRANQHWKNKILWLLTDGYSLSDGISSNAKDKRN